jgi:hypothetical protein
MQCYRDHVKTPKTPSAKTTPMVYTRKEGLLILRKVSKGCLLLIIQVVDFLQEGTMADQNVVEWAKREWKEMT